jgi:hypothetical protein
MTKTVTLQTSRKWQLTALEGKGHDQTVHIGGR